MDKPNNADKTSSSSKRRLMRKSTFISLIGISIAAVATTFVVSQSPSIKTHYKSAITPGTNPHMSVTAFSKNNDGSFSEINSLVDAGTKVFFKVSTVTPIYIALVKTVDHNEEPHAVFNVLIPPGKNRLIEKAGEKYIYTVNGTDNNLTFCVVFGETREQLIAHMKNIKTLMQSIASDACVKLT